MQNDVMMSAVEKVRLANSECLISDAKQRKVAAGVSQRNVAQIKQLKQTMSEAERASDWDFFDPNGKYRSASLKACKAAALAMEEVESDETDTDRVSGDFFGASTISSKPAVEPAHSCALVGTGTRNFEDEGGCSYVRSGNDTLVLPYHAFENVALMRAGDDEVLLCLRDAGYPPQLVTAEVVSWHRAIDAVEVKVTLDKNLRAPVTPRFNLTTCAQASVRVEGGDVTVLLTPLTDGRYVSPQPVGSFFVEGFSGIGAMVGGKCAARLYGATKERDTLVWCPPLDPSFRKIAENWAASHDCQIVPLGKRKKLFKDEDYHGLSAHDKNALRHGRPQDIDGYYVDSEVAYSIDEDDDGQSIMSFYVGNDFQAEMEVDTRTDVHGRRRGDRFRSYRDEDLDAYGKKKKGQATQAVVPPVPFVEEFSADMTEEVQAAASAIMAIHEASQTTPPQKGKEEESTNPFDGIDEANLEELTAKRVESDYNPFQEMCDSPVVREFPGMKAAAPAQLAVPKINVPELPDLRSPLYLKAAREKQAALDTLDFYKEVEEIRSRGVVIHDVIQLSGVEAMSLKGVFAKKQLAEKTLKAYKRQEIEDKMRQERKINEAKKIEKAQKAIRNMTEQIAALREKFEGADF